MVDAAKSHGVDARLGDGIAHLESLSDGSLGGVIACQVIEHLDQSTLKRLVQACARKIKPGGKVIFETINTDSMVALTKNYFRDPTHVFPLHPETMRFMLDLCGLKVTEIHKLSPYSNESALQELQLNEFMTPRWALAIETLNKNIRKLNNLMFGHQDYCIVAEV
jgi:O-antigen chain-terminating methyltransferase